MGRHCSWGVCRLSPPGRNNETEDLTGEDQPMERLRKKCSPSRETEKAKMEAERSLESLRV